MDFPGKKIITIDSFFIFPSFAFFFPVSYCYLGNWFLFLFVCLFVCLFARYPKHQASPFSNRLKNENFKEIAIVSVNPHVLVL